MASVPAWSERLIKKGSYFEGFVDDLDILEYHKRDTITTWGIRRSSEPRSKVCIY